MKKIFFEQNFWIFVHISIFYVLFSEFFVMHVIYFEPKLYSIVLYSYFYLCSTISAFIIITEYSAHDKESTIWGIIAGIIISVSGIIMGIHNELLTQMYVTIFYTSLSFISDKSEINKINKKINKKAPYKK